MVDTNVVRTSATPICDKMKQIVTVVDGEMGWRGGRESGYV